MGFQLLHEVKAESVEVFGDSQLVINQLIGVYECKDEVLRKYYDECKKLIDNFSSISFQYIPRAQNQEANRLAQNASGYRLILNESTGEVSTGWRKEIVDYLTNPS